MPLIEMFRIQIARVLLVTHNITAFEEPENVLARWSRRIA